MFTLGRKIDIHYKTNKIIIIISALTMALAFAFTRNIKTSLYIGLGTFLAWALAREVDPKHEYSAFIGTAISLVNIFYYESIDLLVLLLILLVLRLLNGISGKEITLLDLIVVLGLSTFVSLSKNNSIYMVPLISALITLSGLKEKPKIFYIFLLLSSAVFLFESFYLNYFSLELVDLSNRWNIFIIAGLLLFTIWINFIKVENSLDDRGKPVEEKRIRAAQMLYGSIVLLFFLFSYVSINNLIIHLGLMLGVIVYSLFDR